MAGCYAQYIKISDYIGDSLSVINSNFTNLRNVACELSGYLKGVNSFGVNAVIGGPGITVSLSNQQVTVSEESCPKWYVGGNSKPLLQDTIRTSLAVSLYTDFLKHIQDVISYNTVLDNQTTLVAQTTSKFIGANTHRGGVRMLDGRVFLPPFGTGGNAYIYNYKRDTVSPIGGFPSTTGAFWGNVLLSNGKILAIPYNQNKAILYNPSAVSTDETTEITWPSHVSEAFKGGTLLKDGTVLLSPYGMSSVGIYDPVAGTATNIAMPNGYTAKSVYGCCLAPNGKVLFVPSTPTTFWVYNNGSIQTLTTTTGGTDAYRGAVLLKDGTIFCVPYNATKAAIYNPNTNAITFTADIFPGLESFETGTLLPDGRVFLCPATATSPAIYDPVKGTLETINISTPVNQYYGCTLLDDGRVLLCPRDSTFGLIISIPCNKEFDYSVLTSPFLNKL